MSSKVDIEQIEFTARLVGIDPTKVEKLIKDLKRSVEEEKENKPKRKKTKNQLVAVANTTGKDEGFIRQLTETPIFIVQVPTEDDHNLIPEKISKAAKEYHQSKKGKKFPVKNLWEALGHIQEKYFKSYKLGRKTKEPIIVVANAGEILPVNIENE